MNSNFFTNRLAKAKRLVFITTVFIGLNSISAWAHPMPNSVVLLDLKSKGVSAELQLPLNELELAFGNHINDANSATLVQRLGPQLKAYLLKHIHPESDNHKPWTVAINDLEVQPVAQSPSGPYRELTVHLWLQAPPGLRTLSHCFAYRNYSDSLCLEPKWKKRKRMGNSLS